jgi:hypothetical protein
MVGELDPAIVVVVMLGAAWWRLQQRRRPPPRRAQARVPDVRRHPERRRARRGATLVIGAAVIGGSLAVDDVVNALTVGDDVLTGARFVPILLGLFWPRANGRPAVASIAVSATSAPRRAAGRAPA